MNDAKVSWWRSPNIVGSLFVTVAAPGWLYRFSQEGQTGFQLVSLAVLMVGVILLIRDIYFMWQLREQKRFQPGQVWRLGLALGFTVISGGLWGIGSSGIPRMAGAALLLGAYEVEKRWSQPSNLERDYSHAKNDTPT